MRSAEKKKRSFKVYGNTAHKSRDKVPLLLKSIIGKIVTCELKNPENYLVGLVIITAYMCVGCQTVIDQEVRDFSL